jgi:hypothetical protein
MIIPSRRQWLVTPTCLAALALAPDLAAAQESKSSVLVKEVVQALDQAKLTAVAAKSPDKPDEYVAAMYFTGSQLLVVGARYAVPMYLDEKLEKKEYMEVYIDLNSASIPESKVFVSDLQANGLQPRPDEGQPYDTVDAGGKIRAFDKNWKKQNLTEQDYMKEFADADERYAKMLSVLLARLKKS